MSEKIYPKGINFFNKRDNAPEFVKGSIVITPKQLIDWMTENKQLMKDSEKYGKQFVFQVTDKGLSVDTWKPSEKKEEAKPTNKSNDTNW